MSTEKDPFKLTSIDEHGSRIHLIPSEVRGFFRVWRTRVHFVLLIIFLILPWIKISGHQAILLNVSAREFNFFGLLFRSHDAPLIFLVLAVLVMGLAFVTAIWGRVWCGWACPQTVFIDSVFRRIEYWVEGNYIQRRKLALGDLNFKKLFLLTTKWLLFTLVSSLIAHSFIAYFSGSDQLIEMMRRPPSENWDYFVLVSFVTAVILFDFGWFREQFCVIMCPYGRIQSVLLESNSLAVVYDQNRGEPRRNSNTTIEKRGDCISCNRCVEVCPTGIDIRNGLQMECIACTACIDACDEMMEKVKKPQGLISYKTLNEKPITLLKAKTVFYGLVIVVACFTLVYNLITREPINIALLRATDAPYVVTPSENGEKIVRNHFRLHLTNQTEKPSSYKIELSPKSVFQGFILTIAQNPILLKEKASETIHLFIHISHEKFLALGKTSIEVHLINLDGEKFEREFTFLGPNQ